MVDQRKEIFVRFANESTFYNKIIVDPNKLLDPIFFKDEVFCTIDGIRVAINKEEWQSIHYTTDQTMNTNI